MKRAVASVRALVERPTLLALASSAAFTLVASLAGAAGWPRSMVAWTRRYAMKGSRAGVAIANGTPSDGLEAEDTPEGPCSVAAQPTSSIARS